METILVVLAVLTLSSGVAAQVPSPACRAVASLDDVTVKLQQDLFYEDDGDADSVYTQLRTHLGIQKLAPSEPVVPIRNAAVCEEWLPAIAAALKVEYGSDQIDGYLFQMVQYGPYMLVIANADPATVPPGINLDGTRIPFLFFEVNGKRYLGQAFG